VGQIGGERIIEWCEGWIGIIAFGRGRR
jgi:hypothetical protein